MPPRLPDYWFQLLLNPRADHHAAYGEEQSALFNQDAFDDARRTISSWPGYAPTPLRDLRGVAGVCGLTSVHYKDESSRFGMGSFKPLGGAYAVACLLTRRIAEATGRADIEAADLLSGNYAELVSAVTVTAATDGNHGRSVAWGARMFGCRCVIFIHETVTPGREVAIAALGAEVRRTPGTYDDAVRAAGRTAQAEGWHVIPDTSDGRVVEAPTTVMRGYTLLAAEAMEQLPYSAPPTHIFLQAGVGGMAAAVLAHFWRVYGSDRPRAVLVEPATAACCFLSMQAGRPSVAPGGLDSIMAGLACGEVSDLAWRVLNPGAAAAVQIDDAAAADSMRLLAEGRYGDPPLVAGESAVAGLAALLALAADVSASASLALNANSRVLLFGTEGATDHETYTEIVGRRPEDVGVV